MIPTVMRVFLSDDPSSAVEVPITPNTTATDVIDCCKEPGETNCHLAELWRGKERCVSENEKPYTILQQWGSHSSEVQFYLRHYDAPVTGSTGNQANWAASEAVNAGYVAKDGRILSPSGTGMTLKELKEVAQKQQQQIELQQQTLLSKEQRLRFLKQQMQQQQTTMSENDKLRRLREKAEAQEAKLRKIRALRGKVDQQRYENTTMSTELEAVRTLFEEKHIELSTAMLKVQELTKQLDELRKGKLSNSNITNNSFTNPAEKGNNGQSIELDKLKKEMGILNRMNEDQQKRLDDQRSVLKKRNEDASELDKRIEELTLRLRQRKSSSGQAGAGLKNAYTPTSRMHTIVAAVEPLVKKTDPNISTPLLKTSTGMYPQGLVYSTASATTPSTGHGIIGRIDQAPVNGLPRGQPEGINNPYNQYGPNQGNLPYKNVYHRQKGNQDIYNRPMPPTKASLLRPQSAMAQIYADPSGLKQDPVTAKVRPMIAKNSSSSDMTQANYYSMGNPPGSPSKSTSGGINLFAYKPPPAMPSRSDSSGFNHSNVTLLPSGNIKYTQSPYAHPPPPYPHSMSENPAFAPNHDPFGHSLPPGRSITVDIEALRRKFAHAPRPLKKRSSITEPERPQGPVIPKLLYDQLYKKADTPFYRPSSEHRSMPPPAYSEPPKPPAPPVMHKLSKNDQEEPPASVKSVSYESNITPTEFLKQLKSQLSPTKDIDETAAFSDEENDDNEENEREEDHYNDEDQNMSYDSSSDVSYTFPPPPMPSLSAVPTKGILKPPNAASKGPNRRIKFDPLALLLDASLEGEFDLVKEIIDEVTDSSGANDEGITALHNAVCAGHFELVKFLVHYGSDINASDTDGWTPLHCSASCNNLPMCRFLVENGACIFAATLSDGETAADKCEELDEGYLPCSDFLYSIQDKLGVMRQGQVYALYDYEAEYGDELTFRDGDLLTILKKGDENEEEWWWGRLGDKEGYIPRNLLGMWPRIKPSREDHD